MRDKDEFSTNKNCYTLEEIEGHLSTNLGAPHRSIQRHILNHSPLLEKVSFNTCSQQELNLSRQLSQLPQATSANILPDILNSVKHCPGTTLRFYLCIAFRSSRAHDDPCTCKEFYTCARVAS